MFFGTESHPPVKTGSIHLSDTAFAVFHAKKLVQNLKSNVQSLIRLILNFGLYIF